jgi:hypothetical protein
VEGFFLYFLFLNLKGDIKMFVLKCSCGSTDFKYDLEEGFTCTDCGEIYNEEEAGKHLIEVEE